MSLLPNAGVIGCGSIISAGTDMTTETSLRTWRPKAIRFTSRVCHGPRVAPAWGCPLA